MARVAKSTLTVENDISTWAVSSTIPLVILPVNVEFNGALEGLQTMVAVVALWSACIAHCHCRATFTKKGSMAARALKIKLSSMIMLTVDVKAVDGLTVLGTVLMTLARSSTGKLVFEILLEECWITPPIKAGSSSASVVVKILTTDGSIMATNDISS